MTRTRTPQHTFESRLMAVLSSLLFSVPTAALIWLGVNKHLALFWNGFIGSGYLISCIVLFALIAFIAPRLFPSLLGKIWQGMLSVQRWWGW